MNFMNDDKVYLSDGGLETVLIFHEGIDLPCFASFGLLESDEGIETLRRYYDQYAALAIEKGTGFILETPTWRASADWAEQLDYTTEQVLDLNRKGVDLIREVQDKWQTAESPFVLSGNIGPRGDGYSPSAIMTAAEAREYHAAQIGVFAESGVDVVTAITLNYVDEAIGIAQAAAESGLPVVIGFTTETDGLLPDGTSLEDAIAAVDRSVSVPPAYYMVNCAHVDHFSDALQDGAAWTQRIQAVRANASRLSHAELDESEVLDDGDPIEFGELYAGLKRRFPGLRVFGGCCGTDHRHVAAAAGAVC